MEGPTTRWIVRYRWVLATFIAGLWLLSFNGEWRIGIDSGLYRGVARSLLEGRGYTLHGQPHDLVYPGLPLLLAGVGRLFGEHPAPAVMLIFLCGAACLPIIYRLVRMHYPAWMAWTVTLGCALNAPLMQFSNELLTDVPFLLGVLVALLGWERLLSGKHLGRGATELVLGLALAASMRPTFWVLAAGFVVAAGWKMVVSPRRRAWLIGVAAVVVVAVGFLLLDPRTLGGLDGTYAGDVPRHLSQVVEAVRGNFSTVFGRHMNVAFFAQAMSPLGYLFTLPLLIGLVLLLQRQVLWAVIAFMLIVITLLFSDEPRYYLMVLPILWLAWLLPVCKVGAWLVRLDAQSPPPTNFTRHFPTKDILLTASLAVVVLCNATAIVKLLGEQRSPNFMHAYRGGEYVPLVAMANLIRDATPPDAVIIGPHGAVLSFLSHRDVLGDPVLLRGRSSAQWDDLLADANPQYAVFPRGWYTERDFRLYQLMDRNVLMPEQLLGEVMGKDSLYLARAHLVITEGDWRDRPTTRERRNRRKP